MKLKKFIKKLESITEKHGDEIEVIMADNIPVVDIVYSEKYPDRKLGVNKKSVVVSDVTE